MPLLKRKSLEERIADRQAQLPPLKEGKTFEHGPAKFVFIFLLTFILVIHIVGIAILMALHLH